MNWKSLEATNQVDKIKDESKQKNVLIFKHSTRCSISAASLDRLERKWDSDEMGHLEVYFLDLIRYRDVSNYIADTFGVAHQSPQVLVIRDGSSIYDQSHFGIDYDELRTLEPA
ncbi:MAG: bacillithiol system redox-active protein YtxJ [Cyclobacteriaceae bacterium]